MSALRIKSIVLAVFVVSQEMAVLSSTTACAAITSHTTSSSNVNSTSGIPGGTSTESHGGSSLADKIHGITEKLQALGHHKTESEISKTRTGKLDSFSIAIIFFFIIVQYHIHCINSKINHKFIVIHNIVSIHLCSNMNYSAAAKMLFLSFQP